MDLIYKVFPSKLFFPITAIPSVVALHSLWSLGFSFFCSIIFIDWSWDTLLSFKPFVRPIDSSSRLASTHSLYERLFSQPFKSSKMSILQAAALLGVFATSVAAHGHIQGIVADGTYYEGYNPSFQYMSTPPAVIGWSCPQCLDNGFVAPDAYGGSNIACHKAATPGQAHATVTAGGTIELQWTAWPSSHHGPVIDYLAKCSGECETVDKDTLEFFKIDQGGLVDDSAVPGTWASDQLIANNNSWTVKIPTSIAPGNYVLRHEIIALHSAGTADGAQNYPQVRFPFSMYEIITLTR